MAWRINRDKNFPKPFQWEDIPGKAVVVYNLGQLLRSIALMRERYGGDLRPGWQLRLQDRFCEETNHPNCMQVNDRESDIESVRHVERSDIQRFLKLLTRFIASGGKLVDQALAEGRAEICATCPRNVPILGCMGCSGILPKLLKLTKGASTSLDHKLKGCAVCGCQLKAKVHVPNTIINEDDPEQFPEWCWIRNEAKNGD